MNALVFLAVCMSCTRFVVIPVSTPVIIQGLPVTSSNKGFVCHCATKMLNQVFPLQTPFPVFSVCL